MTTNFAILLESNWLVVYDNVESADLLMPYWPVSSHGKAIITSRNHSLALRPASSGIEISSWDAKTGSEFLLHLLKQDIGKDLEAEKSSAYELSQRLSGHALGISHMAGLIHSWSWSITEFLIIYLKNPRRAHTTELNAIWDFAFKRLQIDHPESLKLLGVASFLMPDNIPQALFMSNDESDAVTGFEFCSDEFEHVYQLHARYLLTPFRFSAAMQPLLALALVKRNRDSGAYSVHRMVQTQCKYFMRLEQRQQAFDDSVLLLSRSFPQMDMKGQLYAAWAECNKYIQHLISLADNFMDERRAAKAFRAGSEFCELINQGQR
jgi:hypothetical protein